MGEAYLQGLQPLRGGSATESVTIVGTKYCPGAFDFIIKVSREHTAVDRVEQCLFLVADTKSNDVVLHNGKMRLGSVAAVDRDRVRKLIDKLSEEAGQDQVLVCFMPFVNNGNEHTIKTGSSLNVYPTHYIYERLARKFADKYRKDFK